MLKKVVENPYLNILTGVILLITSGIEIFDSFEELSVGAHHGVFVFALVHIVKSFPELMHGFKELDEADAEINKTQ